MTAELHRHPVRSGSRVGEFFLEESHEVLIVVYLFDLVADGNHRLHDWEENAAI